MSLGTGSNAATLETLDGWAHVRQSIVDIVTTPRGTRVMRRDYGADLKAILDRPANRFTIVDAVMAIYEALEHPKYGEPRFVLERVMVSAAAAGAVTLDIDGKYVPDGHLTKVDPNSIRDVSVRVEL